MAPVAPVIRDLTRDDLPSLLALYDGHLHARDDPRPADERVAALWRSIEADDSLHYLGAFDGDPGIRPQVHTFVDDRAPWHEICDALPRYSGAWTREGPDR